MTLTKDGWIIFFVAFALILFTLLPTTIIEEDDAFEFTIIDINDSEFFSFEEDNNSAPIILNITVKINEET